MKARLLLQLLTLLLALPAAVRADPSPTTVPATTGVPVAYQLPADGPLPRTYRVTLAIVNPANPDWIVGQFAAGVVRTVTAENGGKFTETWDGLDDNFMPVPPGRYAVRGIYMPAERWAVDGECHTVTPRFVGGASSWLPPADEAAKHREPFGGDPVGAPLADVAVAPNGLAVFYYQYLENSRNNPVFDLNQPVGYGQFVRSYPSGGAGGGTATCTDGQTVWSFSTDGGRKFVYRADGKPFGAGGSADGANRNGVYLPEGWVTAMACWRDEKAGKSVVYVAQRGRIFDDGKRHWVESPAANVDKVTVHDGENGKVLAELAVPAPRGLAIQSGTLYALHAGPGGPYVSEVTLAAGLPNGGWRPVFAVPATITPFDLEVDAHGRFYVSDPAANKVYQLDRTGKVLATFGRLDAQKPGAWDPQTFMSPGKLATWTVADGTDRLLIVDQAGPNRVSEWAADGKFVRDFLSLQTKANDGYAVDPDHPEFVYVPGHKNWLTRFRIDYATGAWTVDAVYPNVGTEGEPIFGGPWVLDLVKPVFVRMNGVAFLCGSRSGKAGGFPVYRLDGNRWRPVAAVVRKPAKEPGKPPAVFLWHDTDGNGKVDDAELTPTDAPAGLFNYHGQNWGPDFSLLCLNQGGRDAWRLVPAEFDARGYPIFKTWERLFADPVFEAKAAGKADALHGGNELADRFSSDWMQIDGRPADGYYVQARGGKNFSANEGAQYKLSRYVSDGKGGYALKWRTGRAALQGLAKPGEMYGGMRIRRPINGLVPVVDQSRCGVLLYTTDGLYVDTIFPDGRRLGPDRAGLYAMPGEFFAGIVYPNPATGKVYIGMGKDTPLLYEAAGWTTTDNPAKPLTTVQPTVTITAAQIATPPEEALAVRGGAGAAKVARFAPAVGGATLDGSMAGWESAEPVTFAADKDQSVEVRCLYDPDHLYLRWHARLASKYDPKPLQPPERIFAHDRGADTVSFYVQGDPTAQPASGPGSADGRPGDVRFVFGLFRDGEQVRPVALGMYPKWPGGGGKATPQTYATPVGRVTFEHVGLMTGVQLGSKVDDDGKGFVIAAAIPRSLVPQLPPLSGDVRTMANFSATFGGHNAFWWANSDGSASRETYDEPTEARLYPGSWAPAVFQGLDSGIVVRNWLICGPFGGPGAEHFKADPNGVMPGTKKDFKQAVREFCEVATYPPDADKVDPTAVYTGDLVRGYWPDPGKVRWHPATVADLDTRVVLGPSGQVWYGAAWVHAPADTALEFQFQGHRMTPLRWFLNGDPVQSGEPKAEKGAADENRPVTRKTLTLRRGWNQVMFRGYCVGYPPFRAGLVLAGPAEKLWTVRLSATPPVE